MFEPLLSAWFPLFQTNKTPFSVNGLPLSVFSLIFSCPRGGWQSCPEAHLAGNSFLPHNECFLLSWRRRTGEDGLYTGIISQSIFSNSKTLPKPSSSQPLSCPKATHATPHEAMEKIYAMMQGPRQGDGWKCLLFSPFNPPEATAWRQEGEGDCRVKTAHAEHPLGATARQQACIARKISV